MKKHFIFICIIGCIVLDGCEEMSRVKTSQIVYDKSWADGQLQFMVDLQHYTKINTSGYSENSWVKTGEEWSLIAFSLDHSEHLISREKFFHVNGESYNDAFSSIIGSDLLLHHLVGSVMEQQFLLFDPTIGKDISKAFPPMPSTWVFNRSRTACLALLEGKAVILDTLSANANKPKMTARPAWTQALQQVLRGSKGVLTEDTQYLILLPPNMESLGHNRTASDLEVKVLSADGDAEICSIPLDRKWDRFMDAESINGKILILSEGIEGLKLINMNGETVHAIKIPGYSFPDVLWNPARSEILCVAPGGLPATGSEFPLWNYESNMVQSVVLRR